MESTKQVWKRFPSEKQNKKVSPQSYQHRDKFLHRYFCPWDSRQIGTIDNQSYSRESLKVVRLGTRLNRECIFATNMIVCWNTARKDQSPSSFENPLSGSFCLKSFADKQTPGEFLISSRQGTPLQSLNWNRSKRFAGKKYFDFKFIPKLLIH